LGAGGATHVTSTPEEGFSMQPDASEILRSSSDADELEWVAVALARSPDAEAHQQLRSALSSASFRDRLDAPETLLGPRGDLNLANVIGALSNNLAPSARRVLHALCLDQHFSAPWARAELLIEALIEVRPAEDAGVEFWDKHCQPKDGFAHLTTRALAENGSDPAIKLLEEKLADARFPDDDRIYWMRTRILTHRDNASLLAACERLIRERLEGRLRIALIEALFDYRPTEWHGPSTSYAAPAWSTVRGDARARLVGLGKFLLEEGGLDPRTDSAVRQTLEQLGVATIRARS